MQFHIVSLWLTFDCEPTRSTKISAVLDPKKGAQGAQKGAELSLLGLLPKRGESFAIFAMVIIMVTVLVYGQWMSMVQSPDLETNRSFLEF